MNSLSFRRPAHSFLPALLVLVSPACQTLDDKVCGKNGCFFTGGEWQRAQGIAGLGAPPLDTSNKLVSTAAWIQ